MTILTLMASVLLAQSVKVLNQDDVPTSLPTVVLEGPIRLEALGSRELRVDAFDLPAKTTSDAGLQIRTRLVGADVKRLVRVGRFIPEEVVDDTGQSLMPNEPVTEAEREFSRGVRPDEASGDASLLIGMRLPPSNRAAKTIKVLRGTLRVFFAEKTEQITIVNPMQFQTGKLPHPRLEELGIEVDVIGKNEKPLLPADDPAIKLHFGKGVERVKEVRFFSAALEELPARPGRAPMGDGKQATIYRLAQGQFTDSTQMVLTLYTDLKDERLQLSLENMPLP